MSWKFDSERPIHTQLLEKLQMQIVSGQYGPGDKLPSVRELATEANVNPNTMQKAFAALEQSGLVCTQRTSGRTVTEDTDTITAVRKGLAYRHILDFINKMKELGYTEEELTQHLKAAIEEGNYE